MVSDEFRIFEHRHTLGGRLAASNSCSSRRSGSVGCGVLWGGQKNGGIGNWTESVWHNFGSFHERLICPTLF
jgi:hypothetical protein